MGVRPDVRELLLLGGVHVHVTGSGVLADHHPLVDLLPRPDQQRRALLEVEERVGVRRPGPVGDEDAVRPVRHLAGPGPVALADLMEERRAAGVGEELAAVPDQTADRQHELHPDAAVGVGRQLFKAALSAGQRLLDVADVVGRDVDRDPLVRLVDVAVDVVQEDLRPGDGELEPLAPHLLDEDRELELAPAADLERVAGLGRADLDRDVAEDLAIETRLDLATGDVAAFPTAQRRGVHAEGHPEGGGVDVQPRQRPRIGRIGDRVADRHLRQPGNRDDVARPCLFEVDPVDAVGRLERGHRPGKRHGPTGLDCARGVVGLLADDADPLAEPQGAVPDPADGHPPHVLVRHQVGHEELQRVALVVGRRRRHCDERVEQWPKVCSRRVERAGGGARLGVRVEDRELDLVLVGPQVDEQLVDLVEDLRRTGIRAVDLVQRHHDGQVAGHRLLQHVTCLRERTFGRVDEKQHGVDHQQAPLDLAAEVGVPGRVDDVQPDAVVVDRRLLGEDRDPFLALEVHRVEDAVDDGLVRAERAGLAEHRVDQGGLAVVDVGDDRDVPEVAARGGGGSRRRGRHERRGLYGSMTNGAG